MSLSKWLPCDFEQCHPLLWSGGILVDHWSTISSCFWHEMYSYITQYRFPGLYSLRRHHLIGIGIPIINLRRSSDRLRFINGDSYTRKTASFKSIEALVIIIIVPETPLWHINVLLYVSMEFPDSFIFARKPCQHIVRSMSIIRARWVGMVALILTLSIKSGLGFL